jgi:SH3-like domain-containing protein
VSRDELRPAPGGAVVGSIGRGEPLGVLRRRAGWRQVETQFGARGWVKARDLCG